MRRPKTRIIFNPAAGSAALAGAALARLQAEGAEVKTTARRGAAERFARRAVRDGCEILVAAGGDGTLNEVANGVGENADHIAIALLPLGTGNDFARTLGMPRSIDRCVDVLHRGRRRAVDLVRVTSDAVRYFVNVSAGGFSGVVDETLTDAMKEKWGQLAYIRGAAAALPRLRAYRANISLDNDECLSLSLFNVVIANGRYVGGGTPIAPQAKIDDGLLDVILFPKISAAKIAVLAPQVLMGAHLTHESVVFRRAAKLGVKSR